MTIRPIRIEGPIAYVRLTRGYEAVIDVADVPLVQGLNWCTLVARRPDGTIRTIYAIRAKPHARKQRLILMHRVILGCPEGIQGDHEDGNGLNNRRFNLREATTAQNQHNQRIRSDNKSGVKGVSWHARSGKWVAQIKMHGETRYLGSHVILEDAATAYATASAELHREFGRLK